VGMFAITLVYGMQKVFSTISLKRGTSISWREAIHQKLTRWYDWPAVIFFLLFVAMVVLGLSAPNFS